MSKSLGNFDNLLDLLDSYDGRAYRLVVLQSHYRSPVRVSAESLGAAQRALAGLDAFAARTDALVPPSGRDDGDPAVLERFIELMDDDLDTPGATALLFDTVRRANTLVDEGAVAEAAPLVAAVREIARAFGLTFGSTDAVPDEVSERAAALDAARATRDYARADAIRADLQDAGWIVETTATGTTVRR
jgi:cysteinyl-tRNA synthetase